MSPRSILKRSSDSAVAHPNLNGALPYPPDRPQVHFPPTPSLTQTYMTHSGALYDRAPIVVLPNDCALPERGCPGRTYDGYDARCKSKKSGSSSSSSSGKSVYPRAVEDGRNGSWAKSGPSSASTSSPFVPPPLVPDVSSSESDESDGVASPPPEYSGSAQGAAMQQYQYGPFTVSMPQEQFDKALAFLPHPPNSSTMGSSSNKEHRKKSDKEHKRTTSSSNSSARFKSNDCNRSFAASSLELDGCLGGF